MLAEKRSDKQHASPRESEPDRLVNVVPSSEMTPVWAQTRPVAPAEDTVDSEADDATDETDETDLALPPPISPPTGMEKGDPDWSADEESTNGEAKKAPEWAQTVPTSPGERADEGQAA